MAATFGWFRENCLPRHCYFPQSGSARYKERKEDKPLKWRAVLFSLCCAVWFRERLQLLKSQDCATARMVLCGRCSQSCIFQIFQHLPTYQMYWLIVIYQSIQRIAGPPPPNLSLIVSQVRLLNALEMFEKYQLLFHRVIEYKTNSNTKILVNNVLSQVTLEPCESTHSQQRFISLVGEHMIMIARAARI